MPARLTDLFSTKTARQFCRALFYLTLCLLLGGCAEIREFYTETEDTRLEITVYCDGLQYITRAESGSTVEEALKALDITLGEADTVTPALSLPIPSDGVIRVTRVTTEETVSEVTLPFGSQTVRNESLPDGETRVIQQGENGLQQVTTRYTYEDGALTSKAVVNSVIVKEAVPEILMQGAKAEYSPIKISGKLVYIADGSAWLMEGSTENRTPLVSTGDLDGRVLDLSDDGRWLLFSRAGQTTEVNSLWMLDLSDWNAEPISLRVENVIHFAAWLPGDARRFIYSSVEPSEEAPGWKASNDLRTQYVADDGMLMSSEVLLEGSSDGTYSWWGTEYELSDDARRLLYADAENIGVIDRLSGEKTELLRFTPYEKARSDWAWIPGVCWNADNDGFYYTFHGKADGTLQTYDAADYHIAFYDTLTGENSVLIENAGIFSYPAASPRFSDGDAYLAYLQTDLPQQPESERYRIVITDELGGNSRVVYPVESGSGFVTPQTLIWSPGDDKRSSWIAFLQQGNIWLVNPFAGIYNQITSDGTITKIIWE